LSSSLSIFLKPPTTSSLFTLIFSQHPVPKHSAYIPF
jgi:hypothetical protein